MSQKTTRERLDDDQRGRSRDSRADEPGPIDFLSHELDDIRAQLAKVIGSDASTNCPKCGAAIDACWRCGAPTPPFEFPSTLVDDALSAQLMAVADELYGELRTRGLAPKDVDIFLDTLPDGRVALRLRAKDRHGGA